MRARPASGGLRAVNPVRRLSRRRLALAVVLTAAGAALPAAAQAKVRHVWVAAVPRAWNIAPNGRDAINHTPVDTLQAKISTVLYQRFSQGWGSRRPNDSA